METTQLLVLQFVLSSFGYAALAFWFVRPWLEAKPYDRALMILVLPHTFRHVGVTLLVPEVVDPTMPQAFARATAVGDTITVLLAWAALFALYLHWRHALSVVWLFNVVGVSDLLFNLARAARLQVADDLGAAWYGPAFIVPGMLVVHVMVFLFLLRGPRGTAWRVGPLRA